jgi:hypothetical protein
MAIFGALLCVILLALGGVYQVLKPRLPQYTIQIQSFFPKFLSGHHHSKLAYQLTSDIQMHNNNFISIHIYALTFDLFYPDWQQQQQQLHHVGQVTDSRQQQQQQQHKDDKLDTENFDLPLWVLPPRQQFQTTDEVIMIPHGGTQVLSSLSWDTLSQGGTIQIPLSGVIHIKADGKIPVTMGMICDNLLTMWQLQIQGLSCQITSLELGWSDMDVTGGRLRQKMEQVLWKPCHHPPQKKLALVHDVEPCGIIDGYLKHRSRVEWRDALPILAM